MGGGSKGGEIDKTGVLEESHVGVQPCTVACACVRQVVVVVVVVVGGRGV